MNLVTCVWGFGNHSIRPVIWRSVRKPNSRVQAQKVYGKEHVNLVRIKQTVTRIAESTGDGRHTLPGIIIESFHSRDSIIATLVIRSGRWNTF